MSGESLAGDKIDLVARNVRRLRRDRGYSLSELARRAGLAKQTLSGIEAGQANPTVLTLTTIATALGIPVAHLLTEYGSPVLVRRAADAVWEQSPDGVIRELDQVYGSGFVRTAVIRHDRTGDTPVVHRSHRPGTLHHALVLSGEVCLGPVGEVVCAAPGDFVSFPGDVPHQTHPRSATAILHMVTTIPHDAQLRVPR
jgi:transcriptional regulator with XRE-family HTH domain